MLQKDYDVIVVGGGPSGLMAAIAAQTSGARTLILEKGNKLGRKLAISGGGRCNVTNAKPLAELMKNIPGNSRFLTSALHAFGNEHIREFFEGLGIRLKEEDRGRVFPVSDKASTVVQALINQIHRLGVTIELNTPVLELVVNPAPSTIIGVKLDNHIIVHSPSVIVATGGCSVPQTGSTGDAYPWARAVGHTIISPYPTEVPLTSDAPFIQQRAVQGISLKDVNVQIINHKGKILTTEEGDLLFSHFGLTGPVALRCSHYVSTSKRQNPHGSLLARIDLLPSLTEQTLVDHFHRYRQNNGGRLVRTIAAQWLPERLVDLILDRSQIGRDQELAQLRKNALQHLTDQIKRFVVPITGTLPLEKATVTGGGVSVREIDPKTMGSKHCLGLYFAGEAIDVHAHTGGYNITVAFSTGHAAGLAAANYSLSVPRS